MIPCPTSQVHIRSPSYCVQVCRARCLWGHHSVHHISVLGVIPEWSLPSFHSHGETWCDIVPLRNSSCLAREATVLPQTISKRYREDIHKSCLSPSLSRHSNASSPQFCASPSTASFLPSQGAGAGVREQRGRESRSMRQGDSHPWWEGEVGRVLFSPSAGLLL